MDWKRAKTYFIIVFLLVNILLIVLLSFKINQSKFSDEEATNTVDYEQENIQIPQKLPNVNGVKMQLITANSKIFEFDHKKDDEDEKKYTFETKLNKSVPVTDSLTQLEQYMNNYVYQGKDYQVSEVTQDKVVYEQTSHEHPIMNNNKAKIEFKLDNGKAVSYKQTYMEDIHPSQGEDNKPKQVIEPKKAINVLFFNRKIKQNDDITSVRLGYHSLVKEPSTQVLQPNWEIDVKRNGKSKTFYVEAIGNNPKITE